jgi:hypothetical protein
VALVVGTPTEAVARRRVFSGAFLVMDVAETERRMPKSAGLPASDVGDPGFTGNSMDNFFLGVGGRLVLVMRELPSRISCGSSLMLEVAVVDVVTEEVESLRRVAEIGRKAFAKNCPKRLRGRVSDSKTSSSSGSGSTVDFHNIRSHLIGGDHQFRYIQT